MLWISVVSLLFLMACTGNSQKLDIHKNVDETLALDSVKVLDLLSKQVKKSKPRYKEEDAAFLDDYMDRYGQKNHSDELSSDDYQVYLHTSSLITSFGPHAVVDEHGKFINVSNNFKWQKEIITDIIEKGFMLP